MPVQIDRLVGYDGGVKVSGRSLVEELIDADALPVRNLLGMARGDAVHVYLFSQDVINVYSAEVCARLRQVVDAHLLREHGARPGLFALKVVRSLPLS